MPRKKKTFTVEELREFKTIRNRLTHLPNKREEIQRQIENLQAKLEELRAEEDELENRLSTDFAELQTEEGLFSTDQSGVAELPLIERTGYVKKEEKGPLLSAIIHDYQRANPKAKTVSYSYVKTTLDERFGIQCKSIANFFLEQLPDYETTGGNRNKAIVLPKR